MIYVIERYAIRREQDIYDQHIQRIDNVSVYKYRQLIHKLQEEECANYRIVKHIEIVDFVIEEVGRLIQVSVK